MNVLRRRRTGRLLLTGLFVLALVAAGTIGYWTATHSDAGGSGTETEGRTVSEPRRIMLAGDSMTQGADGDRTWRYHLWHHLEPHVEGLDFVGPYTDLATPEMILPVPTSEAEDPVSPEEDPAEELDEAPSSPDDSGDIEYHDPHFDQDHNALWGRTLSDAAATIQEDVRVHRPDVLCVMLGINDLLWPVSMEEMEERLRGYVESARASNPDIRVVLAEALPIALNDSDDGFALRMYAYNKLVRSVAADMSTDSSPVISLNVAGQENWDVAADTYDGTHPNTDGELKIAAAFADALSDGYGIGPGYPRPLPIVS